MPPDETYVGMVGPADFQNLNESLRICKIHTGIEGFPVSRDWSQVYSHDLEICLACRAAWRYRSCHFFCLGTIISTRPHPTSAFLPQKISIHTLSLCSGNPGAVP